LRRSKSKFGKVVVIILLALLAAAGLGGFSFYKGSLKPVDTGSDAVIAIEIPAGAGSAQVAEILEDAGVVKSAFFYRLFSKFEHYDGLYKAGAYSLSPAMSAEEIAEILIAGTSAETKTFTIPEGYNNTQIAKRLAEAGICTEDEFWEAARGEFDYAFLDQSIDGDERLEGFLYPDTYEVYADAGAIGAIEKMLARFDELFQDEYYARAEEMGMSVREVVTMGSIIERESVAPEERPIMAGVFYNRLEQGMRLESCATIQYILGEPKEFLTIADTQIESPYNTYLHEGLPPGPICNPRMESIEAALYPDDNDYIYFVLSANLDGTHKFSADYNEFLKNKDAYYAAAE